MHGMHLQCHRRKRIFLDLGSRRQDVIVTVQMRSHTNAAESLWNTNNPLQKQFCHEVFAKTSRCQLPHCHDGQIWHFLTEILMLQPL